MSDEELTTDVIPADEDADVASVTPEPEGDDEDDIEAVEAEDEPDTYDDDDVPVDESDEADEE